MIAVAASRELQSSRPERTGPAEAGAHADARRAQPHRHTAITRRVESPHLGVWQALKSEALRAHASFVNAARGAQLARHRGEEQRAEALTRLARKQHQRWLHASRAMALYEQ